MNHMYFNSLFFLSGSGLSCLTRLQSLRLDSNQLSNIRSDELSKLIQLKMIDVSDCSIENLEVIKEKIQKSKKKIFIHLIIESIVE